MIHSTEWYDVQGCSEDSTFVTATQKLQRGSTQHRELYTREDHYNSYSSFVVIVFIVESSPPDSSVRTAHHILLYAHGKDRYDAHSNWWNYCVYSGLILMARLFSVK